jgi:hypothetical protein
LLSGASLAFPKDQAVREQLAKGLSNTLMNDAKQEEALERRGALLEQLRTLALAFPQDGVLRKIDELLDSV